LVNSSGGEIFIREYIRTELRNPFSQAGRRGSVLRSSDVYAGKEKNWRRQRRSVLSHAKVIRSTREWKLKRKIIVVLRKSIVPNT